MPRRKTAAHVHALQRKRKKKLISSLTHYTDRYMHGIAYTTNNITLLLLRAHKVFRGLKRTQLIRESKNFIARRKESTDDRMSVVNQEKSSKIAVKTAQC